MTVLDSFALTGRKALVTGGNQGLGKAFAAALAEAGADVVIVARDAGRNAAAVADLRGQGLAVSAIDADITEDAGRDHRSGRPRPGRPGHPGEQRRGVHPQASPGTSPTTSGRTSST